MNIDSLNKVADKYLILVVFAVTTVLVAVNPRSEIYSHAWTLVLGAMLAAFRVTIEKQATIFTSDKGTADAIAKAMKDG